MDSLDSRSYKNFYPWATSLGPRFLLASERNERDTIRGVQIRACAVYIYIYMYGGTYAIIVAHATHT